MANICYNLGYFPESLINIKKALEINPESERLKNNLKIIEMSVNS